VHCYDILANPDYANAFNYVATDIPNRPDYIIDDDEDEGNDDAQSDLVRVVLNLGFLTREQAKKFAFVKSDLSKLLTQVNPQLFAKANGLV
jgi:hypothetical protein